MTSNAAPAPTSMTERCSDTGSSGALLLFEAIHPTPHHIAHYG